MSWVIRALFCVLIVLALSAQAARVATREDRSEEAADFALRLASLHLTAAPTPGWETLRADAPGCAAPVTLARIGFDGTGDDLSRRALPADATPRYVYLGHADATRDRLAIGGRWLEASALAVVGLRAGRVPGDMILVGLPKSCPDLAGLDWSLLSP